MWRAVGEVPINIPKRRRKTEMGICYSKRKWEGAFGREEADGKRLESTDVKG